MINTKQPEAQTNSTANHSFQTTSRRGQNMHAFKSHCNQLPPHPFYYLVFMHPQEHGNHFTKKSGLSWKNLQCLKRKRHLKAKEKEKGFWINETSFPFGFQMLPFTLSSFYLLQATPPSGPTVSIKPRICFLHTHTQKMMSRPKQQDSESQAITRFSASI